jgi:hypothetical protein
VWVCVCIVEVSEYVCLKEFVCVFEFVYEWPELLFDSMYGYGVSESIFYGDA